MRPFTLADLAEVNSWWKARKQPVRPASYLPKYGYIQPGVAAGWLFRTDSCIGFLDDFVTNPKAPLMQRVMYLDGITRNLVATAKRVGIKALVVYTGNEGIWRRLGKVHGWKTPEGKRFYAVRVP